MPWLPLRIRETLQLSKQLLIIRRPDNAFKKKNIYTNCVLEENVVLTALNFRSILTDPVLAGRLSLRDWEREAELHTWVLWYWRLYNIV